MSDVHANPDSPSQDEFAALRAIVAGTAGSTGEEVFQSLVQHLRPAIDAPYPFIAEFAHLNNPLPPLGYRFSAPLFPNLQLAPSAHPPHRFSTLLPLPHP